MIVVIAHCTDTDQIMEKRLSARKRLKEQSDLVCQKEKEREQAKKKKDESEVQFYRSSVGKNLAIQKSYENHAQSAVAEAKGKFIVLVQGIYGDAESLPDCVFKRDDILSLIYAASPEDPEWNALNTLYHSLAVNASKAVLRFGLRKILEARRSENGNGSDDNAH